MHHITNVAQNPISHVPILNYPIEENNHNFDTYAYTNYNHSYTYEPGPRSDQCPSTESNACKIQNLLKGNKSTDEIERMLDKFGLSLNEDLVLNVLKWNRSNWKPAYTFFNWISRERNASGYLPGSGAYNEVLDILGKMKRFEELGHVLEEMSKRTGLVNERTYRIVLNRYCAAHKVEEATQLFYKRSQLGLELDLIAFQTLLRCLCQYRHVEAAEFLYHSKQAEFRFPLHIKTMNIILNGWSVIGRLREVKRFWNEIITSEKCKPDVHTYGIFINSLIKAGKLNIAVKLFQAMWEKGIDPDVAICNCIIDGLCLERRIPEALEIFREMNERECLPDVVTYNSLIKHLCKVGKMKKVYELLDEMEKKKGGCLPNSRTYGYILKSIKKLEEVDGILERMRRNGMKLTGDAYNLLLKLFTDWDCGEKVHSFWVEMERDGLGPDQRSYTIMIHWLYDKGRVEEAMGYYEEMKLKDMITEPRTNLLINAMNLKRKEKDSGLSDLRTKNQELKHRHKA